MTRIWVPHAASSASYVRHRFQRDLSDRGVRSDDIYDSCLIFGELLGNAVRHAPALASGQLLVEWTMVDGSCQMSVTDGGTALVIEPTEAEPWHTSGRGLAIVAALSDHWGVVRNPDTTTVWARRSLRRVSVQRTAGGGISSARRA